MHNAEDAPPACKCRETFGEVWLVSEFIIGGLLRSELIDLLNVSGRGARE